ncbi:MAG: hypothetical protein ACPGVU_07625 [Limisphaerales bacterium]
MVAQLRQTTIEVAVVESDAFGPRPIPSARRIQRYRPTIALRRTHLSEVPTTQKNQLAQLQNTTLTVLMRKLINRFHAILKNLQPLLASQYRCSTGYRSPLADEIDG